MKQDAFLGAIDDARIVSAIQAAEARSRGEIRVHVAQGVIPDARRAAETDFARLGMTATAERNGVLILVAPESQSFAVVGDLGIDERSSRRASGTRSRREWPLISARPASPTESWPPSRASPTSSRDTSRDGQERRTGTSCRMA